MHAEQEGRTDTHAAQCRGVCRVTRRAPTPNDACVSCTRPKHAGLEGTLAPTIRTSGLRQTRYVGVANPHVQQGVPQRHAMWWEQPMGWCTSQSASHTGQRSRSWSHPPSYSPTLSCTGAPSSISSGSACSIVLEQGPDRPRPTCDQASCMGRYHRAAAARRHSARCAS
jgi:hypothetical protein